MKSKRGKVAPFIAPTGQKMATECLKLFGRRATETVTLGELAREGYSHNQCVAAVILYDWEGNDGSGVTNGEDGGDNGCDVRAR